MGACHLRAVTIQAAWVAPPKMGGDDSKIEVEACCLLAMACRPPARRCRCSTARARSSSSTAACWRRRGAPTCRCWSGCATCASSRPTWTSSSRCASPTTSRRRACRAPGCRAATLQTVAAEAHALIDEQYALFNDELMPALQRRGHRSVLNHAERNAAQRALGRALLRAQVRPLLVPVGLDPSHPFPQVANKSLNFIVRLGGQRRLRARERRSPSSRCRACCRA